MENNLRLHLEKSSIIGQQTKTKSVLENFSEKKRKFLGKFFRKFENYLNHIYTYYITYTTCLNGGQEQRDQNPDDRNHDK
jgi:uncharacterized damage-inducible protein DinB